MSLIKLPSLIGGESAIRSDAEDGIAVTRWLLAMISAALYLGTTSLDQNGNLLESVGVGVALLLVPSVAVGVRRLLERADAAAVTTGAVLQLVDTLGVLVVAAVASRLTTGTAWALLTVPIVISALRFGALGVLATWATVSASQVLLTEVTAVAVSTAEIVERAGTLLAVAAVVALLTSWLQAGWEGQARSTGEAERRIRYLRAVEEAIGTMHDIAPEKMLLVVLEHGGRLDFGAVTAWHPTESLMAVGDGSFVPVAVELETKPGVIEVTEWVDRAGRDVTSVSVYEPNSGRVITGWTNEATSQAQIEAFGDLVTQASSRIELATLLKAARTEAKIDPLTGLWRRHVLDERLEQICDQPGEVALLFVDLDYFKQVNDTYGHHVGDETLAAAGRRLRRLVGNYGFVARYGGDEFVVLLSGRIAHFAGDLATRAAAAIGAPLTIDGQRIPVGATIGTATGRAPMSAAQLIKRADEAVLSAKAERNARVGHDGRNLPVDRKATHREPVSP